MPPPRPLEVLMEPPASPTEVPSAAVEWPFSTQREPSGRIAYGRCASACVVKTRETRPSAVRAASMKRCMVVLLSERLSSLSVSALEAERRLRLPVAVQVVLDRHDVLEHHAGESV